MTPWLFSCVVVVGVLFFSPDISSLLPFLEPRLRSHDAKAQASKTREVAAQQKLLVLLKERVKVATISLETTKAKRQKVQGFLKVYIPSFMLGCCSVVSQSSFLVSCSC